MASVLSRFDALLGELKPGVAIVLGDSDAALVCSLAANKRGIRVLHADGQVRSQGERRAAALNGALIDRIASLIVTNRISDHSTLSREGIPAERVLCLGSLLTNVVQGLKGSALSPGEVVRQFGVPPAIVQGTKGYGVATLQIAQGRLPDEQTVALIGQLKGLPPLLWLVDSATDDAIRSAGLSRAFDKAHVVLLPSLALPDAVALLAGAAFLVCDASRHLADVAEVMDVACIELVDAVQASKALRDIVAMRPSREARSAAWDGGPGQRIAEQISLWLQP
jgi:hypothetical protein